MMTALRQVKDWGWNLYVARYYRDQEHALSGESPLLERKFVETDSHVDNWVYGYDGGDGPEGGWPTQVHRARPGWAAWELLQEGVESTLRFVADPQRGGTRVVGSGWCEDLPPGWMGRPVERW